jgi:LysM repeat protein
MNSPNPFVPQGSLLELQSKRRSRVKVAVFCVLAINVVGLMALLMQGCKREQNEAENPAPPETTNETAMMNTNLPPEVASNPPVAPTTGVTVPPTGTETAGPEYVVVKGDSLWKIAKKNGVTVKAIEAANPGVNPSKLKVGQKLSIPGATGAAPATTGMTGSAPAGGAEIYVVKSGDTLTRIAKRYGITARAIQSENSLSTTRITVGQKLKIPAKTESAPAAAPVPAAVPPATSTAPATDTSTSGSQ